MNILVIRATPLFTIVDAAGGLFDFNGTLPLIVGQFTLLSLVLTFLFYKPVSKRLEEREIAISCNLRYSSCYLLKASINSILYYELIESENKQAQSLSFESKKNMQEFVNAQVKKERGFQNLLLERARSDEAIQIPEILKEYEYRKIVADLSGCLFRETLTLRDSIYNDVDIMDKCKFLVN